MSTIKETIAYYAQLYHAQEVKLFDEAASALMTEALKSVPQLPSSITFGLRPLSKCPGYLMTVYLSVTSNKSFSPVASSIQTALTSAELCDVLKTSGGEEIGYSAQFGYEFKFSLLPTK